MELVVEAARGYLRTKSSQLPIPSDSPFKAYVFRQGVRHLLEGQEPTKALNLLDHLGERDDLEPHLDRGYLRQFAKLISIVLNAFPVERADKLDADKLEKILKGFYEIEPLRGGLRLLLEHPSGAWSEALGRFLDVDDFVILYAIALTLAEAYHRQQTPERLRAIVELTERADVPPTSDKPQGVDNFEYRELGFYALKLVYARHPEMIDGSLLERLASGEVYVDRMILGELLLTLVFLGMNEPRLLAAGPRERVTHERFWRPLWSYNRLDIVDLDAAWHFVRQEPLPPSLEQNEEVRTAYGHMQEVEQDRQRLLNDPEVQRLPAVLDLLDAFYRLTLERHLIRAAEAELERLTPHMLERVMRVLFAHPLWDITENAGTVLSSIAERDLEKLGLIGRLMQDRYWRVRYAAIEAAFGSRLFNDHVLFSQAVRDNYSHANPRVRGLCSENLTAWIVNSPLEERPALMERFAEPIHHWVHDLGLQDCWLLDHMHHLFSELRQTPGFDCARLLEGVRSPLLQESPPWYTLPRPEFLRSIEERQRTADFSA